MNENTIQLKEFDNKWSNDFYYIKQQIEKNIPGVFLSIEHIGSTAITNIKAKNVIDIQCSVKALPLNADIVMKLVSIGYKHLDHINQDHVPFKDINYFESGWEKLFFMSDDGKVKCNLHIRVQDAPNWKFALNFRDYLNSNENVKTAYEQVKERLSAAKVNIHDYCAIKDPVCDLIYLLMSK